MENKQTKAPAWFWVLTIIFLLWNLMGVMSFLMHVFITEEALQALPENERALYGEYPLWTDIVFALAVLFGMLGAVGLVLRKKWAKMIFILSLLVVIPQMIHNVFFTSAIEVYGTGQAITMPILVVVLAMVQVWFSSRSTRMRWLQ